MATTEGCRDGEARVAIPAFSALTGLAAAPGAADTPAGSAPTGSRFGDYELLEPIAQGGMGAVYRARQLGIGRVVALKMILAGRFASEAEVQRFRAEARAAGALDHPHIVPVYDVGEHEGRHYFTMKLVTGGSLAGRVGDYTRDPRAAAALVAAVARAVHHAHQHGVLHRDLKPSNILLDEAGRPYVTDFGLAKRFDDEGGGLTQSEAAVGTPSYMAPELAAGGAKRATVAADVYGLGAILYELLTGRPPFRADTPLETLRRVREQEPSSVRSLNRDVARDLETVCLKCLAKEPGRRYASAEALAEDLEGWLTGKSVRARRSSVPEHAWRWSRRHPAAAALVAVVLLSAVTLGAGGLWHAHRVGRALDEARRQNARAGAVTDFLEEVLKLARPERTGGRKLTVEEALDVGSRLARERLADQPLVEADVRTRFGSVYHDLGKLGAAEREHRNAMEIRRKRLGDDHADTATSMHNLGEALSSEGVPMRARTYAELAYRTRLRRLGPDHADTLASMDLVGRTYWARLQYDEAERILRRALEARRRTLGPSHPEVFLTMANLARVFAGQRQDQDADAHYRAALEGMRKTIGSDDRHTLSAMVNYARALEYTGKYDASEKLLLEALDTRARLLTWDHRYTQRSRQMLGQFLLRRGGERLPEAERVMRELVDSVRSTHGPDRPETHEIMSYLGDVLEARGDHAGALSVRTEMMRCVRAARPPAPPAPRATSPLERDQWVELLSRLDVNRHAVRGKWRAEGTARAVEPMLFARAALPVEVKGSFELKVEFTRTQGSGSIQVILPAGKSLCMVSVSELHGRYHLLQDVWGKGLIDNPTARDGHIENNVAHHLCVTVAVDGDRVRVDALLDDKPCFVPWEGPQAGLIEPRTWSLPAGATMAIGSHRGHVVFQSVKVRVGRGEAHLVEFDQALWHDPWPVTDEP